MKILKCAQIKWLDEQTILEQNISSWELMERASYAFTNWFTTFFPHRTLRIAILAGSGNNGGDALAIGRLLHLKQYRVSIFDCRVGTPSKDRSQNLKLLPGQLRSHLQVICQDDPLPFLEKYDIIIDGLFGSGINRTIEGYWSSLIDHINRQPCKIVSIDIPSGLHPDNFMENGTSIHAHTTLSFELPKRAFFHAENQDIVGHWHLVPIGLSYDCIAQANTDAYLIEAKFISEKLRLRGRFQHKGHFGHGLIISGSYGKMGAALLAGKAALRTGLGLLTIHAPKCGYDILQTGLPEAMVIPDDHDGIFTRVTEIEQYEAVGFGCGIGTNKISSEGLKHFLEDTAQPLVLDADGLNIISKNKAWLSLIPKGTILTPHPKEFDRLFGPSDNSYQRHERQVAASKEHGVVIILKGAYTCTTSSEGNSFYNGSGNPGMATAGSGDVLTGILTSLLAQEYQSVDAALVGVHLHGLAGDLAALEKGHASLIARDIIEYLGPAFKSLHAISAI